MKKWIGIVLVFVMMLTISGCATEKSDDVDEMTVVTDVGTFRWEMTREELEASLNEDFTFLEEFSPNEGKISLTYRYTNAEDAFVKLEEKLSDSNAFFGQTKVAFHFQDDKLYAIGKGLDMQGEVDVEAWRAEIEALKENVPSSWDLVESQDEEKMLGYDYESENMDISFRFLNLTNIHSISYNYAYAFLPRDFTEGVAERGEEVVNMIDQYLDGTLPVEDLQSGLQLFLEEMNDYGSLDNLRLENMVTYLADLLEVYETSGEEEAVQDIVALRNEMGRFLHLPKRQ